MPTLYLIDGSAYIYRAFFALPPLSNSKGLQTNAVYGFTTMMLKILRDHRPDYVAVVFDERGPDPCVMRNTRSTRHNGRPCPRG